MTGLVSSEWLRFRSRRLVKALAVATALGIVVALVIGSVQSDPPTDAELARAERRSERTTRQCIGQGGFGGAPADVDIETFCREQFDDPALFLSDPPMRVSELPEVLRNTAFIAILIGLVVGASAVGASWQTGTMTTILTWEPRRVRVALVRLCVVAVGAFVLAAALLALLSALFWVATTMRGVSTIPPGWWTETAGVLARVAVLSALASAIGGGVAMIGRNTAAALGAVFVYVAVLEGIVRGLRPALGRFLLGDNIAAFVIGDDLRIVEDTVLSPSRALVVVLVYAVTLAGLGTASFRVRDVQ
jgi:ABC-2 type transport system permease protein